MKYYVTADIHSYFKVFYQTLEATGFFADQAPHKLIICGDLFDRGEESLDLQNFILDLMEKDQVILIRGNHEDLALDLLNNWHKGSYNQPHHYSNSTLDTVAQLTKITVRDIFTRSQESGQLFLNTPFVQKIIPAMVDYFETDHYIFTHGWIPCDKDNSGNYLPIKDWRRADEKQWKKARWINGMEAAHEGITEPGKTIVCGHWHCSFGHAIYEDCGAEKGPTANYAPYQVDGQIIALDACTALSKKINCIVIEDTCNRVQIAL